jgi:hypothetical protein
MTSFKQIEANRANARKNSHAAFPLGGAPLRSSACSAPLRGSASFEAPSNALIPRGDCDNVIT